MNFFEQLKKIDLNKLHPLQKEIFIKLKPLLEKILPNKLDLEKSIIKVYEGELGTVFTIEIYPIENKLPSIIISFEHEDLYYAFADYHIHYHKFYSMSDKFKQTIINEIINEIEKYLNGVYVESYYDSKKAIAKEKFYFSKDKKCFLQKSYGFFNFFKKVVKIEKQSFTFYL